MPPGSIFTDKELAQTYQPLFLMEFTLKNGDIKRYSSHPLHNTYAAPPAAGSYQFQGYPWEPRVLTQDIGAIQAMSDLGTEIVPQVSISLADPDKTLYAIESSTGFKGAVLKMYSTLWDAGDRTTGAFSTNSPLVVKFIGTCSSATDMSDDNFTLTATSLMSMGQIQMPPLRVQPKCSWTFPPNAAARAEAVDEDSASIFKECGYSYGEVGGVGNSDGGSAFTFCDYSFEACIDRLGDSSPASGFVPIEKDQAGNYTGRFGGFRWIPQQSSGMQRSYLTGKWEEITNASNETKYGDLVPLCYGSTWTTPLVMGVWTDGNYTNFEVLICYGEINKIKKVVVNGNEIARIDTDTFPADATTSTFKNGWWGTVNRGTRNGRPSPHPGWGKQGDPYGSFSCIYVSVLRSVAGESSIPNVQILLEGVKVRKYTDVNTHTVEFSDNPAWILLDVLTWTTWKYENIDIQSFIDAAAKCDEQIYFDRMDGTYANVYLESGVPAYKRFSVGFTVRQRTAAGELIRGLRNSMKAMLFFDYVSGKLKLQLKQTFASQQPAPIEGSNYNTPVPSVTVQGVVQNGYAAYHFDGSCIIKNNGRSTLNITQRSNQEVGNKLSVQFQNRENSFSQDSTTIVDSEDVERLGQDSIGAQFPVIGAQTFDHVRRVVITQFAEAYRGNPRLDYEGSAIGDTGGTLIFDLETTIKGIHLMVGQLCLISDAQHGISLQPVRVQQIQPLANGERMKIRLTWHNDNWYQDSFGQVSQPLYSRTRSVVDRAPFSWRADNELPVTGDALYSASHGFFGVSQLYEEAGDATSIAKVRITGKIPVNSFPDTPGRPKLELIGAGTTGGGYPTDKTYYVGLSARNSTGTATLLSALSRFVTVKLESPNTALSISAQHWPDSPSGYFAFVGLDPFSATYQASATATPSTVVLTNTYNEASWGAPDEAFVNFRWKIRREIHAGVLGQEITGVTTASISLSTYENYGFDVNQFAGRELSILGISPVDPTTPTYVPIANFTIGSNTSSTFMLAAGDPTTCVYGQSLKAGDVAIVRMAPTYGEDGSGKYFEDLGLINALNSLGTLYNVISASNTSPVVIELAEVDGEFPFVDGAFVIVQGVLGNGGANGGFVIGACNPSLGTFELVGSVGTATYDSGGTVGEQIRGLIASSEKGCVAFIIAGTGIGTSVAIKDNTDTRYYIVGDWPVTPDSTSRIVILESMFQVDAPTNRINNRTPQLVTSFDVDVSNYRGKTIFVQASAQSANGASSLEVSDPFREMYLFGDGTALIRTIQETIDLSPITISY